MRRTTAERADSLTERSLTFQTRQVGDPEGFVRTFGVLLDAPAGPRPLAPRDVGGCAEPSPPPNCVNGKVVVLARGAGSCDVVCYQRAYDGAVPAVVACCNGAAAAAAHYAAAVGRRDVSLRLTLSGRHVVQASARVSRDAAGAAVQQTWRRVPFTLLCVDVVDGRSCAVCVGALNHYVVVRTRPGEDPAQFPVAAALRLARRFGLDRAPLLARIAVVECVDDRLARLKVFTCGERAHPSAPPTGLAVLALAAGLLDWLRLRADGRVLTPAGWMELPRTQLDPDGTATVRFAPLLVQLERERAPAVAVAG